MLLLSSLVNMKEQGLDLHIILGSMETEGQNVPVEYNKEGIFGDSNLEELMDDFNWGIIEEKENSILIKDDFTVLEVPKFDIPNRFDDDCANETLYVFNKIEVIAKLK